jgi:hypothetical protein
MVICPYDGSPLLDTKGNSDAFADTVGTELQASEQPLDPSLERAAQLARKIEYREKLSALLNSKEGLRLADAEMQSMFSYVKDKVTLINQKFPSLRLQFGQHDKNEATVSNPTHVIIINWHVQYANSLSESRLQIVEIKQSRRYPKESSELKRLNFDFYMDDELKLCWKARNDNRRITTEKLGQECIDRLLHLILTNKE